MSVCLSKKKCPNYSNVRIVNIFFYFFLKPPPIKQTHNNFDRNASLFGWAIEKEIPLDEYILVRGSNVYDHPGAFEAVPAQRALPLLYVRVVVLLEKNLRVRLGKMFNIIIGKLRSTILCSVQCTMYMSYKSLYILI